MYQIVDIKTIVDFFSPLELSVVAAVLAAAALSRAYAPLTVEHADRWTGARGVDLTEENWPAIRRYLQRARIFRTWGAIGGLVVPTLIGPMFGGAWQVAGVGTHAVNPAELGLVFFGYLGGAVCAELTVSRPLGGPTRSAALLSRELADYLPRELVWLQRGLAAAGVLGVASLPFLLQDPGSFTPSVGSVLGFASVIGMVAVGLERLQLWIVRRPQPYVNDSSLAADDAIRAQSVHSLAGAGIAFLLFMCSLAAFTIVFADAPMHQLVWAPGLIAFLLALAVCQYYGDRAWRVQRARRAAPPTTPA